LVPSPRLLSPPTPSRLPVPLPLYLYICSRLLADALHMATLAYLQVRELDLALRSAHEAQVLFQRAGDRIAEADALRMIALIDLELLYEWINSETGPKRSQAIARLQTSALRSGEKSVVLARKSGAAAFLASTLHTLAQVLNACGYGDRALDAAREAETLFQDAGEQSRAANALVVAADACVLQGDRQAATEMANRAATLFKDFGDADGEELARSVLRGTGAEAARSQQAALEAGDQAMSEEAVSAAAVPAKAAMDLQVATTMARETVLQAIGGEEEVDLDSPLMDVGLDSLAAISFREALIQTSGMKLPSSLVFDYPSLLAIAQFMVEESMTV